jgi:hypothetical protein
MCMFFGQFACVCACSTGSELRYLLGISESLLQCHSADKPRNIVQHSDNAPHTFALSHLPRSAAVFGHKTNFSLTKLHVTAESY